MLFKQFHLPVPICQGDGEQHGKITMSFDSSYFGDGSLWLPATEQTLEDVIDWILKMLKADRTELMVPESAGQAVFI